MILRIKTKANKNGNTYGIIIDTDKKFYVAGYGVISWGADLYTTKTEITDLIKYNLDGFTAVSLQDMHKLKIS